MRAEGQRLLALMSDDSPVIYLARDKIASTVELPVMSGSGLNIQPSAANALGGIGRRHHKVQEASDDHDENDHRGGTYGAFNCGRQRPVGATSSSKAVEVDQV
jgi:hypothetical protein